MIEREFVREKIRNFKIKELVERRVNRYAGIGDMSIEKTPMGERIIIHAHKPGLVIGSGGETVKGLTQELKDDFGLETPQIEVKEITQPDSWAAVVAKKIASDFERFGPKRYKASGYRALTSVIRAGARGAEIRITGVGIPGARARSWRFFAGYLKKSGDTAETVVDRAFEVADLKRGTVGIKVAIMPAGVVLPDDVTIRVIEEEASETEEKELKDAVIVVKKESDKKEETKPEQKASDVSKKKEEKTESKQASNLSSAKLKTGATKVASSTERSVTASTQLEKPKAEKEQKPVKLKAEKKASAKKEAPKKAAKKPEPKKAIKPVASKPAKKEAKK